ncbi:flagellar export chaperone FliS [Brevibacillus choshinensis]|uniref:Flagellar export chaperone FliS n=1 Tax=Brevibacillus choshinensis TaxID=54911 RepID=A0ABX7FPT5_BRECH|nr:flagellar export chaperone FliS [Brevibacillus choshinensis]QRG67312.1 flagellar export chaperone FliS [Brevibacillus choshinensis]
MTEVLTEQLVHQKSPQELTKLLYTALIEKLESSSKAIKQKNYLEANQLLQNCNDILYRLGAGINYEAGIVADQLEAIYNYMADRIIEANMNKSIAPIDEVLSLIKIVADAWNTALARGVDKPEKVMLKKKASAYDQDFYYDQGTLDQKE